MVTPHAISNSVVVSEADLLGSLGVKPSRSVASWPCTVRLRTEIWTVAPGSQLSLTVSWASGAAP